MQADRVGEVLVPEPEQLEAIRFKPYPGDPVPSFFRAVGCANCAKTGYKGVTADFSFDGMGNLKNAPVTISAVEGNDWKVKTVVQ